MGLGSKDDQQKKELQNAAGRSDWKDNIKGVEDAELFMDRVKQNLEIDGNGEYLMAAYMGAKMRQLEDYVKRIRSRGAITFKDYLRECNS